MVERAQYIKISKPELEAMLEEAAEKGAQRTLQHFGVFKTEDSQKLVVRWNRITNLMDLYDNAALSIGKGFLWLVGAAIAIVFGAAGAIKLGIGLGK